jgi:hypothetical protein
MSALMDLAKQDFKKRLCKSNRVWTWTIQQLELIFPYQYDFAAAFDEIKNAVKWTKQLHGITRKPFTVDSELPSDLNIIIKGGSKLELKNSKNSTLYIELKL